MFAVNEYFNGNVKSIAFKGENLPSTVGVMAVGEYEFGTSEFETMTVISGSLIVKLPERDDWQTFKDNDTFTVEANQKFLVKVTKETAYLCTYGK